MEIKDIISFVVALIVAIIGVSSIRIITHKIKKGKVKQHSINGDSVNIEQHVQNGNGNIQAGRDVDLKTKDWK